MGDPAAAALAPKSRSHSPASRRRYGEQRRLPVSSAWVNWTTRPSRLLRRRRSGHATSGYTRLGRVSSRLPGGDPGRPQRGPHAKERTETMPTVYPLATRRSARSHSRPVGSGGPHPYPYHRGDVSAGREEGQGARSSSIHRPQRLGIVRSTPWVGPLRRRPAPGAVGAICTHSAAQITLRVIVAGKGLSLLCTCRYLDL